jgi:hypothetical protein
MEEFRDIPGFPGLKATSFGRIIGKKGKEIGCFKNKYVIISGRSLPPGYSTLSRANLILRAFVGEPPADKPECDHIDRNKHNDRPENLRWADRYEQMHNRGDEALAHSGSGVKGLYLLKATLPNHSDRWRCTVSVHHTHFVKYFRIDQIEEATAWLINKREELMG